MIDQSARKHFYFCPFSHRERIKPSLMLSFSATQPCLISSRVEPPELIKYIIWVILFLNLFESVQVGSKRLLGRLEI